MSQMCPSSSHQLVAAAIAFHRAREKFPQNSINYRPPSSSYKDIKTIGDTNRVPMIDMTSNVDDTITSIPRLGCGCCCRRNCESTGDEHLLDKEKSNNRRSNVGDSIAVGISTLKNVENNKQEVVNAKKLSEEFKDIGFHAEPHSPNPIKSMNQRLSLTNSHKKYKNKKSICHGDSINLFNNDVSTTNADTVDNDRVLLRSKLHEWKHQTHEASLIKMQRFLPSPMSALKRDLLFHQMDQNNNHYSHELQCYSFNHNQNDNLKSTPWSLDLLSRTGKYSRHQRTLNHRHDYVTNETTVLCQRCKLSRYPQRAIQEDTDDTEDDERVKGLGLIKHKDSLDILVEKFKNRKILGKNQAFERPRRRVGIDEKKSLSCEKILDQETLNEAIKECFTCEDHETCCTRKNFHGSSGGKRVAHKLCHCYRQNGTGSRLT